MGREPKTERYPLITIQMHSPHHRADLLYLNLVLLIVLNRNGLVRLIETES